MTKVFISHNPYKVCSEVKIDGVDVAYNSPFATYLKERFQLWVDLIPDLLLKECNDDEYEITFHGTNLDYQDLLSAISSPEVEKNDMTFAEPIWIPAKEFGEKEQGIKDLIAKAKELPFDELKSHTMDAAFQKAFDDEFEVNVVATMSAGKSTLINALLQKKLMPSKQGACTATITKIKDDDDDTFKATAVDNDGEIIGSYSNLDYKTMSELNKNPNVSEVRVSGNIPFVRSEEISLILIDTPGPDNARDKRHGMVTEKALDESSKMLVLFVMNGGKLHDEAQDKFLRKIAKSMSVGGKQSRERFLFVINKLDAYEEEDDDIAEETIPDTISYLEEMGIENPNIFPAAANPALLIRRYQNTFDESEKEKLLKELQSTAQKLIDQKQLHLETYAKLSRSSQEKIQQELDAAIESGDIFGEALVHTGIRGIEETINTYVTKYCRPAKITNVVEKFKNALESAEAFEKTKAQIATQTKEQKVLTEKMEKLEEKLSSKAANQEFRDKIAALDITTDLAEKVDRRAAEFEEPLTELFANCEKELDKDTAKTLIRKFKNLANEKENAFQAAVDMLLERDIQKKGDALLEAYIKKLDALSQEYSPTGITIDLASYVKGTLSTLDAETALDRSEERRTETRTERITYPETKKRKWFNPMRIFKGDYYEVQRTELVPVPEEIKYISRDKLLNALISPITAGLVRERRRILEFAGEKSKELKAAFNEQFDKVDDILANKTKELRKTTESKVEAEMALKDANDLLNKLKEVRAELDAILEI